MPVISFTMEPIPIKNFYDYVCIGSSPLSLLHVIMRVEEGARILILNKEDELGGCWSWTSRDGLEYERAAHLIEALPGVYELLQDASGVRFVNAPSQPERQICGPLPFKVSYFSKFILLCALFKIYVELIFVVCVQNYVDRSLTKIIIFFLIMKSLNNNVNLKLLSLFGGHLFS